MKIPDTVQVALITVGGGAVGAFLRGIWDFFTKRGDHNISAWEQWRKDNTELRATLTEAHKEITEARAETVEARAAARLSEKDKEIAEALCENMKAVLVKKDEEISRLSAIVNNAIRASDEIHIVERERQIARDAALATNEKENPDP